MQNGKCTLCGFVPCADGNHSYNTEGYGYERHICQICGYISDCVDEDDDCACDICNWEYYHYNEPQKDENLHWVCCEQCGLTSAKDPHYDYNEDGKCDFCGYNMNGTDDAGTGSDDSGLDNVPKTGDVSILVMGAMVLLFGTGAVLAVKKYAI